VQGELIPQEELPEVRGKSMAALAYSRQRRADLLDLFKGHPPSSIMRKALIDDRSEAEKGVHGSYTETAGKYVTEGMSDAEKAAFSISDAGCHNGALSVFPQNVGRSIMLLYSEPGDIVVDPFAGHNSRMEFCVKEGRHYVGYDISERFMKLNKERAKVLRANLPGVEIVLHHADSRHMAKTRDGFGDFTITSPPYYDIEQYGDEAEQLGKMPTYEAFLDDLQLVLASNYRCLKPGAYAAWFVNDFRRDKRFHAYHMDLVDRAKRVGFIFHDILIVDLGGSFREAFLNQIVEQRIIPKRHEYGLIFRKPEAP
jgi:DNA modification methylase